MSIVSKIENSIHFYVGDKPEDALEQVLIAVDRTAKNEYPNVKKVGERYKAFLEENRFLIQLVAINAKMGNQIAFKNMHVWEGKNKPEFLTLPEIIYHIMRCNLLHESELPTSINFWKKPLITLDIDKMTFSENLILGLILAVMGSPTNRRERLSFDANLNIWGKDIQLNTVWGKKEEILRILS